MGERAAALADVVAYAPKPSVSAMPLGPSLVSSDELIGNVVQVIADDLRLWPNS